MEVSRYGMVELEATGKDCLLLSQKLRNGDSDIVVI
jgi:hypothetical protein